MVRLLGGVSFHAASFCTFFQKALRSCVILAIGFGNLLSFAQQPPKVLAPHKPIMPRVPKALERNEPGVSRSMVGGLWMIDANRKASIYLRNDLETSSLTVKPSLYLSNGVRYQLDAVTLEASETKVISINEALSQKGISPWATLSGYVEVEYTWAWDPLCISVTSIDPVHSVIFTYGFQPSLADNLPVHMTRAKVADMYAVEGMWWKSEANISGFVALSNITAEPVSARVQAIDNESKVLGDYAVRVSPHGTKIVALQALEQVAAGNAGGLRVLHTGSADGMLINGGLEDLANGYSANLAFHYTFTPAPEQATPDIYAELGLMTGEADPMMAFPVGTRFTPFSVARNVSDKQISVVPTVYWMQGGTARSARLPSLTLLPSETRIIDVPSLLASTSLSGLNGSVNLILEAQGKPRSLLLASGSVDQKNSYVFQVPARGIQESEAKTISYWSTGNGDDTMVTIWNPADESQDYRYTLFFAGGHYSLPIHLEARATRVFNISEIIQNQIPDEFGDIIPATVHEGSAKIAGAHADNEEILVALDAGTYNVRKATCSYYCISCDGTVLAYAVVTPFNVGKGGTYQLSFTGQNNNGTQYSATGTWSSNKTSVATVTSINSGFNGRVTGVSPGTATFTASAFGSVYSSSYCAYDPHCPYNASIQGSGTGNITPTVSITGPTTVPLLAAGAAGRNTIGLGATVSPSGGTYLWSLSSGSGIVALSNTTSGTVTVTSQAVGAATVQVKYTYNSQSATASWNVTVQKPTYLSIVTGTSVVVPEAGCTTPNNACGTNRQFQYQVLDQSRQPISAAGMQLWDMIFTSSPNSCSLTSYATTCTAFGIPNGGPCGPQTDSTGQFHETLTICSTQCRSGAFCITGCSTGANQTWNVNGFSLTADIKALSYQCNGVYVNSQ